MQYGRPRNDLLILCHFYLWNWRPKALQLVNHVLYLYFCVWGEVLILACQKNKTKTKNAKPLKYKLPSAVGNDALINTKRKGEETNWMFTLALICMQCNLKLYRQYADKI